MLSTKIKTYEEEYRFFIEETKHTVIRLDGDSFSKFTRGFEKPFDKALVYAMQETTKDLFKRFNCVFAYTQSDEITLVIPKGTVLYKGQIQKITSITAGYTSTRFNYHLKKYLPEKLKEKLGLAWFDSRVFGIESEEDVLSTVLWRTRDAERNSISMLACCHFSHKELMKKNSADKKEMLLQKEISWENLDEGLKYGFFFKRELYKKEDAERRKTSMFAKKFFFSEEDQDLIFRKDY